MTSLTLTRPQKAAAILVAMGKPSASRLLKFFKQEELKALIEGARLLRTIPQADLERIVGEFEAEFTEGAGLLDSADRMDTILNESLSPEEMSAIMGEKKFEPPPEGPPPIWPDLEKLEPTRLGTFLAGEHPQTSAMVLSKLAPQTAANVLLTMEKPLRSQIVKRMVTMATIPDAAAR
ncbi:MAG: flagellar motor switch protein FliG, partial [Mesorhizobium sp.]